MAGNRRRKQENSGVRTFLYVVVVLILLGGMGYLFYYSRSQAKERQEYIKELESKEAATKGMVEVTIPEEPESESESESESEPKSEPESAPEKGLKTEKELPTEKEKIEST